MLSFAFNERFVDTTMASQGSLLLMGSITEYSHEVTVGCMHIHMGFFSTKVNIERADRRIWFNSI